MGYLGDAAATTERLRVLKFLVVGIILLGLFTGLRGCSDYLPNWMVGESKQELAVKSTVLEQQLEQAHVVIEKNAEDALKVEEAKIATEVVYQETVVTAKKITKATQAKKKIYNEKVNEIEADPVKTEQQKLQETFEVSVDAIWDVYEAYKGDKS